MSLDQLMPRPQKVETKGQFFPKPEKIRLEIVSGDKTVEQDAFSLVKDLQELSNIVTASDSQDAIPLRIEMDSTLPAEGYHLSIDGTRILLAGSDAAGLFYAGQTLLQIIAFSEKDLECVEIEDWPRYPVRELMVDMGRGIYPFPMLKRMVRILSRLKLNSLHVHLYDDHLCSIRFNNLPLGKENPWAITIQQLGELVRYARKYHVTIVPELESWGHAGSILYHFPELYGAPGMWEGYSFGIGEELFQLLEKIYDEIIPVLEKDCTIHLGLDEANWAFLPSVKEDQKANYSPEKLVGRLYDLLQEVGKRHDHQVTMRIWADHGGRPVPKEIADKVIVEPWAYFRSEEEDIRSKVTRFTGQEKSPFMMAGGMSSLHLQGAYAATRIWCQAGDKSTNTEGIDICFWESNDVPSHLIGIYAGAGYAWSPFGIESIEGDTYDERLHGLLYKTMKKWQAAFPDAQEEGIRKDLGPEVYQGIYLTGPLTGQPVAPTSLLDNPRSEETRTK